MLLVGLAAMMLILIGVIRGLMSLATWLGWPRLAVVIGALGAIYFVATSVDILFYCGSNPVFVPPTDAAAGAAQSIAGCQGEGGELSYAYATLAAPIAALFLAVSAWRNWVAWREVRNA